ncbi:MAG: hypothetical protein ACYDA8_09890 [Deferrisomatales bacterium]
MTNPYCQTLGIAAPDLGAVKDHPEANTYGLLLVALLERGEAMTLAEVARRFDEAGVAPAATALASLKRCRPARPPVYRDGDRYALDPHDHEAGMWAFRLGLRPPWVPRLSVVRPEPPPLPGPEVPLTADELREAWKNTTLWGAWSARRLAVAVLDAHGGALRPEAAVAFVRSISKWSALSADAPQFGRKGSPVQIRDDRSWVLVPGHGAVAAARQAVRARLAQQRQWGEARPDPAVVEAHRRAYDRQQAARAAELAGLRRAVLHAFPAEAPAAVVLVDAGARELRTYLAAEFDELREHLAGYDWIGAEEVRGLLARLGLDPESRRLAELGPPQKSVTVDRWGRALRLTTALLVRGTCGIARPFGDPARLREYLRAGQTARLVRRLERDAVALFAYYEYGRLHGAVRLRWAGLDERLRVPWVHWDEPRLRDLLAQAEAQGRSVEVVTGSAPGWADPWARAKRCGVVRDDDGYTLWLVDEAGWAVDEQEVQGARLAGGGPGA